MSINAVNIDLFENIWVLTFTDASICTPEQIKKASEQIRDFLNSNQPQTIIFDFSLVKFFSSQVLGILIDTRSKVKHLDCKVAISGINPQLHRVFSITNLDTIFEFFKNTQSAIKALKT